MPFSISFPFSCSIDKPIAAPLQQPTKPKVKSLQEELLEAEEHELHKKESLSLAIPTSKGNTFSIAHKMNCLFWQFFHSCIFIFTNYLGTLRIIYLCCISTHTLHTYFRVLQESWKPSLTMGTLILVTPPTILLTKTKTLAKLQKVKLFLLH